MLEQHRVPDEQVGSGETGDLVIRVVPGHDPQQRADGGATDHGRTLTVEQLDRLVGEELLGAVGVEAVDRGGELDLADAVPVGLAHLALDDPGELVGALLVQLGHAVQALSALGDGAGVLGVRAVRCGDGRAELVVGDRGERAEDLAGGRVGDGVAGFAHAVSCLSRAAGSILGQHPTDRGSPIGGAVVSSSRAGGGHRGWSWVAPLELPPRTLSVRAPTGGRFPKDVPTLWLPCSTRSVPVRPSWPPWCWSPSSRSDWLPRDLVVAGTATASAPAATASGSSGAAVLATPAPASHAGVPAAEAPTRGPAPVTRDLARTWTAPVGMPTRGRLLRVEIPGTVSHFRAWTRPGLPAAGGAHRGPAAPAGRRPDVWAVAWRRTRRRRERRAHHGDDGRDRPDEPRSRADRRRPRPARPAVGATRCASTVPLGDSSHLPERGRARVDHVDTSA